MALIRKIAMVSCLCTLTACADNPGDCFANGSSGTMFDVVILVAGLTCAAVVAASDAADDEQTAAAAAPPQPAAAVSAPAAPADDGPADPADQYVLALQSEEPDTSRYWLCRSASQEHKLQAGALYQLGDLSLRRYAAPVESYKWFTLAQQHGNSIAPRRLGELRGTLTAEQVATAEALAGAWTPGDCGELAAAHPAEAPS